MKKLASAVALAAAALFSTAPAQAEIVVSFTPSSSTINIGEAVVIDVSISGLGNEVLAGFDLNFLYNPVIVDWTLVQYFGAPLGNTLGLSTNGFPAGNLGFIDSSLDDDATLSANQANEFKLFSFTLVGKAGGTTTFTLGADPDFERNFVGLGFNTLQDVVVGSAEICVRSDLGSTLPGQSCGGTPGVPEPASYGLAGVALLAAGWAGRGRRRTVKAA